MFNKFKFVLLLAAGALLFAGCEGSDGAAGPAGAAGASGADGVACWDLDQDGVADPEEDLNGDGVVNVDDCRAPLPGTAVLVTGEVTTTDGPLDRFVTVGFTAAGGAMEWADVAIDGTYEIVLAEGDYDATAGRPGYEDVSVAAFAVTDGVANVLDFELPEIPDGEFVGSDQCGECHTVQYASFAQTGHPFKLNRAFGTQPSYPFTSLNGVLERITDDDAAAGDPKAGTDNPLGTPVTYDDVSYVIGGYFWKARFVDLDGAIVTGTETQYNFATDEMVAYHNDESDKYYNCGNCHTTGWRRYDAVLNDNRQDGMQFMQGTFHEGGIQCEACHGAGASHVKFTGTITRDAYMPRSDADLTAADAGYGDPIACGECHTRDGERDYPTYVSAFETALASAPGGPLPDPRPFDMGGRIAASGGLIKHHEQYDEILGIDPDTLDTTRSAAFFSTHGNCSTCHNPHGSAVNVDNPLYAGMPGVDKSNAGCVRCHDDYDPALRSGGMQGLACIDCHMPYLAKSAVKTDAVADRPAIGDVSSHIFTINLDTTRDQFTGSFAYPEIDEDWACRTCHNSAPGSTVFPIFDAGIDTYVFHNNIP